MVTWTGNFNWWEDSGFQGMPPEQEKLKDTWESVEQGVLYDMNRLSWGIDSISLKFYYQVWYMKKQWKCTVIEEKVLIEPI